MSFSFLENHVRGDFNSAHAEKKTDQYWKDVTACTQLLAGNLREEIPQLPHVRVRLFILIPAQGFFLNVLKLFFSSRKVHAHGFYDTSGS